MTAPAKFFYTYSPKGIDDLAKADREELLDQIGEYLKFTMLDMIGESKSPVNGEKFEKLSKKYAAEVGHKQSNLERDGDLLDSLDFKTSKDRRSLDIGFFDKLQAAKAFGHTTGMEGHPWLEGITPERKILPMGREKFNSEIVDGIDNIIQEFLDANKS